MAKDLVILVNGADEKTVLKDKAQTHIDGDLHRAFTVVVYRINPGTNDLELLVTQRSAKKETWGGIWDCTYSSHQHDNGSSEKAAYRKMPQELGIEYGLEDFKWLFKFYYWAQWNHPVNGIRYEHEIDHVLMAQLDFEIDYIKNRMNTSEIQDCKWIPFKDLKDRNRGEYGPWTNIILDRLVQYAPFSYFIAA